MVIIFFFIVIFSLISYLSHALGMRTTTHEHDGTAGKPDLLPSSMEINLPNAAPLACQGIETCPPHFRQSCNAYRAGTQCWAVAITPCCSKDRAHCVSCMIYTRRMIGRGIASYPPPVEEITISQLKGGIERNVQADSDLHLMKELGHLLSPLNNTEEIAQIFINRLCSILLCERGALYIADSEKGSLVMKATYNWTGIFPGHRRIDFSLLIHGWVASHHFPLTLAEARKDLLWKKLLHREQEVELYRLFEVIYPVVDDRGKLLSLLFLGRKSNHTAYTRHEYSLISMVSETAGISIKKALAHNLSVYDGLSGLHVVRYFREVLGEELKSPNAYSKGSSLMILDIDHFKKFNDTYGHQQGDMVIKEVARLIRENLRGNDTAARYGGEELAVIFPSTSKEQAYDVAERIRRLIESTPFPGLPDEVRVTVSLGIATFPQDARESEELIRKADRALYEAKHRGRNMTVCSR